jgi:hypothetical protein
MKLEEGVQSEEKEITDQRKNTRRKIKEVVERRKEYEVRRGAEGEEGGTGVKYKREDGRKNKKKMEEKAIPVPMS